VRTLRQRIGIGAGGRWWDKEFGRLTAQETEQRAHSQRVLGSDVNDGAAGAAAGVGGGRRRSKRTRALRRREEVQQEETMLMTNAPKRQR